MPRPRYLARSLGVVLVLPFLTACSDDDDDPADITPSGPRTYTVQPGGLADALAVARDGDVLRLAPGEYAAFETGKGVRILGGDGVVVVAPDPAAPSRVAGVADGQVFAIVDVVFQGSDPGTTSDLVIDDCAGAVVVEEVAGGAFRAAGSEQIALVRSSGRLRASGCADIVALDCTFTGAATDAGTEFALQIADSAVACVDGAIVGADGPTSGAQAVVLSGDSSLKLAAIEGLAVRAGAGENRPPAIGVGVDMVTADPDVTFDPPQEVTREEMQGVIIGESRIGMTTVVDVVAPPETAVTWLLAPLASRRVEEGVEGEVWLDPAVADGLALTTGESTRLNIQIPGSEVIRGGVLVVQGVATTGPTKASIPGVVVIR